MLSNDQVRAELERIDNTVLNLWDQYLGVHDDTSRYVRLGPLRKALRLLAESQQALGEIIEKHDGCGCCTVQEIVTIARNAVKGEYRGPKLEPILPVSLRCKCGYVLKPQDKLCPMCKKLFGCKGGSNG